MVCVPSQSFNTFIVNWTSHNHTSFISILLYHIIYGTMNYKLPLYYSFIIAIHTYAYFIWCINMIPSVSIVVWALPSTPAGSTRWIDSLIYFLCGCTFLPTRGNQWSFALHHCDVFLVEVNDTIQLLISHISEDSHQTRSIQTMIQSLPTNV